jgi:hypothetical protein
LRRESDQIERIECPINALRHFRAQARPQLRLVKLDDFAVQTQTFTSHASSSAAAALAFVAASIAADLVRRVSFSLSLIFVCSSGLEHFAFMWRHLVGFFTEEPNPLDNLLHERQLRCVFKAGS